MKKSWPAMLVALTGCATMQLALETENYQGKWVPVQEGDTAGYAGIKRIQLYVEDDDESDGERAFSKAIEAQHLPDWVFVVNDSLFRVAYASRNRIEEWSHNPYRLEKTYTWQNYPHALPPDTGTTSAAEIPKRPATPTPPDPPRPGTPAPTPQTAEQQYAMGLKYQHGDGVAQSDAEAARWFRRAADRNHAGAQYSLGILFLNGWGVAKNENEAHAWMQKAADQGHAQAKAKLAELTPKPAGDPPRTPMSPPEPSAPRLPDAMPD